jgi:uncharacterized protein
MKLPGIVTNVTDFGAFVDIGVHQDGLVHISQIAEKRIKHPSEALKVSQKVMVTVTEVDIPRKRIALSMRENPFDMKKPEGNNKMQSPKPQAQKEKEESMEDKLAKLKGMWKK